MTEAKSADPSLDMCQCGHEREAHTELGCHCETAQDETCICEQFVLAKSAPPQLPPRPEREHMSQFATAMFSFDYVQYAEFKRYADALEAENESLKAQLQIAACECSHDEACALFLRAEKAEAELATMRDGSESWKSQAMRLQDVISEASMAMMGIPTEATREALAQCHIALQDALAENGKLGADLREAYSCPHCDHAWDAHTDGVCGTYITSGRNMGAICGCAQRTREQLRDELAPMKAEREKALEVIREYRKSEDMHEYCNPGTQWDDRCPTCIKADDLLKEKA